MLHNSNKNIAIVGFGREGKSLADFLYRHLGQTDIAIYDKNSKIPLPKFPKLEFHFGKNYLKNLRKFDIIYLSPGVSPHLKEIKKAKKSGVKISSATELFFDLCPAKIIGITGTKGKGTVATILCQMLQTQTNADSNADLRGHNMQTNADSNADLRGHNMQTNVEIKPKNTKIIPKIFLAGNIGKPAIQILPRLKKKDLVIMELSSFQLQNLKKSPHIAVVLKITSDHLDYHKNLKEYFEAKTAILRRQKPQDIAIIHKDNKKIKFLKRLGKAKKILFDANSACSSFLEDINFKKLKIPGKHNLENSVAAAIAAKICKVKTKNIQSIINNFKGRGHRLEFIQSIGGAKYYNDSAATNPDATIAAISSFQEPKILIMGGKSKGADYQKLGRIIAKSDMRKIILCGENKQEMARAITKYEYGTNIRINKSVIFTNNLKQAVKIAKKAAQKGDVVLFSPASASFDQFKNYEERGLAFKKLL